MSRASARQRGLLRSKCGPRTPARAWTAKPEPGAPAPCRAAEAPQCFRSGPHRLAFRRVFRRSAHGPRRSPTERESGFSPGECRKGSGRFSSAVSTSFGASQARRRRAIPHDAGAVACRAECRAIARHRPSARSRSRPSAGRWTLRRGRLRWRGRCRVDRRLRSTAPCVHGWRGDPLGRSGPTAARSFDRPKQPHADRHQRPR